MTQCPKCGTPFEKPRATYCSRKCQLAAYNDRRAVGQSTAPRKKHGPNRGPGGLVIDACSGCHVWRRFPRDTMARRWVARHEEHCPSARSLRARYEN